MIEIKNLSKSFENDRKVIANFDLKIEKEGITCLLGPSGCGKTTLLRIIAGLSKGDSGSVEGIDGVKFGYVFQEDRLLPWLTVKENIDWILPKENKIDLDFYLNMLEINQIKNLYPKALSGGMKQRVSIARAFAFNSDIIIMDEPFKSLDYSLKLNLMKSIIKLNEHDNKTILIVTHDVQVAAFMGQNIILLEGGPLKVKSKINSLLTLKDKKIDNQKLSKLEHDIYSKINPN